MYASPEIRDGAFPAPEGGAFAIRIPVVGEVEPYPKKEWATVTELHPVTESEDTQPIQTTLIEAAERDQPAGEPQPSRAVPPQLQRESAGPASHQQGLGMLLPPQEPQQLPMPDPPKFKGVGWVNTLFGASIVFSALGQIMFWGTFFESFTKAALPELGKPAPWVIAVLLGGVMEAAMVIFTDLGLERLVTSWARQIRVTSRKSRVPAWAWLLGTGIAIALACILINVAHWWKSDHTAAVTFGAVGAIGFAAHLAKGLNKAQTYLSNLKEQEDKNRQRWEDYQEQLKNYEETLEEERKHRRQLELKQVSPHTQGSPASSSTPKNERSSESRSKSKPSTRQRATGPRKVDISDVEELLRDPAKKARITDATNKVAELKKLVAENNLEPRHRNTLSTYLTQLGIAS